MFDKDLRTPLSSFTASQEPVTSTNFSVSLHRLVFVCMSLHYGALSQSQSKSKS